MYTEGFAEGVEPHFVSLTHVDGPKLGAVEPLELSVAQDLLQTTLPADLSRGGNQLLNQVGGRRIIHLLLVEVLRNACDYAWGTLQKLRIGAFVAKFKRSYRYLIEKDAKLLIVEPVGVRKGYCYE